MSTLASRLVRWQVRHGRHDLPWQGTRDPYRIWLSEVMLQQTRVATVIPYYERFFARFPDVKSLAGAPLDDVLALWSGLGYYSRARNREREAILDGNVKRVLARHFAVRGYPGEKRVENRLWKIAESQLPGKDVERYTQALMDLGAGVCTRARPACATCPLEASCEARSKGRVEAYPRPRPRKPVPLKKTAMLLLLREGEVLLEKRPPVGIWGGLWCLPEISTDADPRGYCRRRFGARLASAQRLPLLRHGFTHFTLDITPVVCRVASASPCASEPGQVWLPLEEAAQAAVPAPVRKLLNSLQAV